MGVDRKVDVFEPTFGHVDLLKTGLDISFVGITLASNGIL